MQRHFTWRKALLGGALAFVGLGVMSGGYMAMRVLGIGPAGTLMAAGVIGERDPLIVADFENRTEDSTLGASVTEAFRIDLGQSPVVRVLEGAVLTSALQRMGRDLATAMGPALAREVAEREGARAYVVGEIAPLGAGFVLSARVMSATTGDVLLPLRETAADETAIIAAVDRLSGRLRERLGESLKSIRRSEPLEQVTTGSLDALKRYTQAVRVFNRGGWAEAIPLLEETLAMDSTFAMAYRKLSVALFNTQSPRSRIVAAARKTFQYRDRLPPKERYLADAYFYAQAEPDVERVVSAYQSLLELDPDEGIALNNLAVLYNQRRRFPEAEELALRATTVGGSVVNYQNAIIAQLNQGKFAAAETTLARLAQRWPTVQNIPVYRSDILAARGDYAAAAAQSDSLLRREASPLWRAVALTRLAEMALVQGKVAESDRSRRAAMAANEARGAVNLALAGALSLARMRLVSQDDPRAALREVEAALARHPVSAMSPADRPYPGLATLYARAGRVDLAKQMMAEYEREVEPVLRRQDANRHQAAGAIALAEGRLQDAVTAFRRFREEGNGPIVGLAELAEAYDRLGDSDSAVAYYEQFADMPTGGGGLFAFVMGTRAMLLGQTYQRLGELHERGGDRAKAVEYYHKLVELWKDADPELQPVVRDVRGRLARLVGERE